MCSDVPLPRSNELFGSFGLNQRALYNHALSVVRRRRWHRRRHLCTPLLATGSHTETSYLIRICPQYMHIKYLVILT